MTLKNNFLMSLLTLSLAAPLMAADQLAAAGKPTDAAMMQAMKLGATGENHGILESGVGSWSCIVRGWMKAGDKPQETKGTSENTLILGGRFLKQDFKGDWAGQPFEGTGTTGYDNIRGEYQSVWMDNMSTGIMESVGAYDAATRTLTSSGNFSCPLTGEKARWFQSNWKIIDRNNMVYTSYFKGPDGVEFKSMEIVYHRVK